MPKLLGGGYEWKEIEVPPIRQKMLMMSRTNIMCTIKPLDS